MIIICTVIIITIVTIFIFIVNIVIFIVLINIFTLVVLSRACCMSLPISLLGCKQSSKDHSKSYQLISQKRSIWWTDRSGLLMLLQNLAVSKPTVFMISSSYEKENSTVFFHSQSRRHSWSAVKQGSAIAPTLFGIFFSMLLLYAVQDCTVSIFLRTRKVVWVNMGYRCDVLFSQMSRGLFSMLSGFPPSKCNKLCAKMFNVI